MKRRKRWRRFALWAGLSTCGGFALLFVFSLFCGMALRIESSNVGRGIDLGYEICLGTFQARHRSAPGESIIHALWAGAKTTTFELDPLSSSWRERLDELRVSAVQPDLIRFGRNPTWVANIPLWIPLAILAVPALMLWRAEGRDRRRRAAIGKCSACGYNLTGNVTGRCPECGAAAAAAVAEPDRFE